MNIIFFLTVLDLIQNVYGLKFLSFKGQKSSNKKFLKRKIKKKQCKFVRMKNNGPIGLVLPKPVYYKI